MKWNKYIAKPVSVLAKEIEKDMTIRTIDGILLGSKGDFLLKGDGGRWIVRRKVFLKKYKKV